MRTLQAFTDELVKLGFSEFYGGPADPPPPTMAQNVARVAAPVAGALAEQWVRGRGKRRGGRPKPAAAPAAPAPAAAAPAAAAPAPAAAAAAAPAGGASARRSLYAKRSAASQAPTNPLQRSAAVQQSFLERLRGSQAAPAAAAPAAAAPAAMTPDQQAQWARLKAIDEAPARTWGGGGKSWAPREDPSKALRAPFSSLETPGASAFSSPEAKARAMANMRSSLQSAFAPPSRLQRAGGMAAAIASRGAGMAGTVGTALWRASVAAKRGIGSAASGFAGGLAGTPAATTTLTPSVPQRAGLGLRSVLQNVGRRFPGAAGPSAAPAVRRYVTAGQSSAPWSFKTPAKKGAPVGVLGRSIASPDWSVESSAKTAELSGFTLAFKDELAKVSEETSSSVPLKGLKQDLTPSGAPWMKLVSKIKAVHGTKPPAAPVVPPKA